MSCQRLLIHFAFLFLTMMVQVTVSAEPLRCEKVVISGEGDWPPFSYVSDGQLKGASVDLVKLIFHELNIPVEVRYFHHQRDLEHELERGDVDVIVGTYDVPRYEKTVRLVLPHYYEDSLGIVVPSGTLMPFSHWDDLMGRIGMTPSNMQLSRAFALYAKKNLNVTAEGDLKYNIRKLKAGEYEYIVGSAQMLNAGVNWYGDNQLSFLPMLVSAEDLYMGFSAVSECKNYAAFARHRLTELRDSGVIERLIFAHNGLKDGQVASIEQSFESLGSKGLKGDNQMGPGTK